MGLFEKARNITDTELRILVRESPDPSEALRRHILSLEESQRQLSSSRGFLERQRKWLEGSAERKLGLAEEWEKRAATAAAQGRDDLAGHALLRKKDLLRSMSDDHRELERIRPQLDETATRLSEVRQKILKARAVRERFFEGRGAETIEEPVPESPAESTAQAVADDSRALTEPEQRELDEELKDLKRRLKSGERGAEEPS
jgi:phage shock protein A